MVLERFLKGYSDVAKPLYNLTKKNSVFKWDEKCEDAFVSLKDKLTTAPVLAYPNEKGGEFILDCDASNSGIGAVLSQIQGGDEKVISYASRTLSEAEQMYYVTRKEMLAVVFFTKYFKHYFLGRHFTVRSDHSSLRWLSKFREPTGQVHRWLEQLSQYDYTIVHRPGLKHRNADFMSRIVRGNDILCKQCEMPLEESQECQPLNSVSLNQESVYNIHMLFAINEDDNDSDGEEIDQLPAKPGRNKAQPKRRKRKRGRTANKPPQATYKAKPNNNLTVEALHGFQEGGRHKVHFAAQTVRFRQAYLVRYC